MIRAFFVALAGATFLYAPTAAAQLTATRLTIAGCSCDMGNTTVAEYTAGSKVSASSITYTVATFVAFANRTSEVYVRANSATMTGGKATSECEWRRSDLATWTALTTTDALVETRIIGGLGATWNNAIFVRCSLSWVNDPPGAQAVGLTFTLRVIP